MIFKQLKIGGDRNFAYIIGDPTSKSAAVIDPGVNPELILDTVKDLGLVVTKIINTHSHSDHIGANQVIKDATGAEVYGNNPETSDICIENNDVVTIGELRLKVIYTPGHTKDSICILAGSKLCTGDTLFVGKVGGTRFGDHARREYDSLHGKILTLPDETEVYPGHDYGSAPTSTIGHEKLTNPFLLQPDFAAFVHLKKNWAAYKVEHGIS
ncbi:MBL fold metallo-hydrolase [bacterium]|nr:MBL fold metallo-hydrolase [bacterium]